MKHEVMIKAVDGIITTAKNKGIIHLSTDKACLKDNILSINNHETVNFGSCSYLGLEFDDRLKQGAHDALECFGTQFSSSRAYISCALYEEVEERFQKIFNADCIVTPTTTLGHIATIPIIVHDDDAVILDHQVHSSVQNAVQLLKPRGIKVDMIRHNRMDLLEERIKFLYNKYERIWYMADGIYSMYGDKVPLKEIYELMEKYPKLHFYVDDAHGMSCYGKNGEGYVLSEGPIKSRMVVATSLAKAFATGGAVIVFPNKEMAQKVRNCGGPLITSGPLQPPVLGAALASADLHLSEEFHLFQKKLQENIHYANALISKYRLPLINENDTPIFFVGVGLPKVGYNLVKRMLDDGFYTNLGIFPAVPMKNTGVRFTITALHTFEQIEQMIESLAHHFPLALTEEGFSLNEVKKAFNMQTEKQPHTDVFESLKAVSNLSIEHVSSIKEIDKEEWNNLFVGRGSFDWDGINLLEESFFNNNEPENNWTFDYIIIRDSRNNKPVLATFLTTAINKDDMFAPAAISAQIEEQRKKNPYYLTSKVLCMGSYLTLGDHLYVDYGSKHWKECVEILLNRISKIQDKNEVSSTVLRDFANTHPELDKLFSDNGFLKLNLPANNVHQKLGWKTTDEYLSLLSPSSKKHVKRYILNYENKYDIGIVNDPTDEQIDRWYDLYLNVKNRSYEINSFTLPKTAFINSTRSKDWEVIELRIKESGKIIGIAINQINGLTYNFQLVGIDYDYQNSHRPYKQVLYQVAKRANRLGMKVLEMGVTTDMEKKKVGAEQIPLFAYLQVKDNYNQSVIQSLSNNRVAVVQ